MSEPPVSRHLDTDQIRARMRGYATDGLPKKELAELETDAATVLKQELRKMHDEYAKGVAPGYSAEMLVRDACTAVSTTEGLWQCEPTSVLGAVMSAGQLGLRIGVLGHAWVLPIWSSHDNCHKAQLFIGYQGYIHMCYLSGVVVDMATEVVYQKEADAGLFEFYRTESQPHLMHRPDLSISSRRSCPMCHETNPDCKNAATHGDLIHAFYATARTKGRGYAVTRPWGLKMMIEHGARYGKGKGGGQSQFWRNDLVSAGRKTMARELTKLLPKAPTVAHGLAADFGIRTNYSPKIAPGDATVHEGTGTVIDADEVADTMAATTMHPADQ